MPVLQARRTVGLVADAGSQPADLLVQRFPIALARRGALLRVAADALAGYKYMSVAADRVEIRRGAEAGARPPTGSRGRPQTV